MRTKLVWVMMVLVSWTIQASVMGQAVNVAPYAGYTYPTDWPGAPSLWADPDQLKLTNGNLTDLVLPGYWDDLVVLFDLGEDMVIDQMTVYSMESEWNNNMLLNCTFYANTEAEGGWSTWADAQGANWSMDIPSVDKILPIWRLETGSLASPVTARYIAVCARGDYSGGVGIVKGITEIEILSASPMKPVFSPGEKYISGPTAVTITSPVPGSTIYYTTDGTEPTTAGSQYSAAVTVNDGTVLKAIAVWNGESSAVASQTFEIVAEDSLTNIAPLVTYVYPTDWPYAPSLWTDPECTKLNDGNMTNLVAPEYNGNICVIFDLGEDRAIAKLTAFASDNQYNKLNQVTFYANTAAEGGWTTWTGVQTANWSQEISTVDKTDAIWTVGTGVLATPITARYIAMRTYASEYPSIKAISEIGIYTPEPVTSLPIFSPAGKYIGGPRTAEVTCADAGASIYYTTDGTPPTPESELYTAPVSVQDGTVLKAIAVAEGCIQSSVASVTYEVPASFDRPEFISAGAATIDGDLSDWGGATWTPLDQIYNITDSTVGALESDVPEAYYAARWELGKVYVAVKVRDTAHSFTDGYTGSADRDAIEVYLHTDNNDTSAYATYNRSAQQYAVGIRNADPPTVWTTVGSYGRFDLSGLPDVARAAGQVVGEWIYYEIAMTPFTYLGLEDTGDLSTSIVTALNADDVIGLDVCVVAHNGTSYAGMKAENLKTGKGGDWEQFGVHKLSAQTDRIPGDANTDGMVDVGDLGILAANYGGTGKAWAEGDFNGDGAVDVGDLGILAANYGSGASGADFEVDYAKTFGTAAEEESADDVTGGLCSGLGLPLIAGLLLAGLMLVKLDD